MLSGVRMTPPPAARQLGFNPLEYYVWRGGRMHNGLTVAAFQLVDVAPGDGGLGIVCGSHKSNVKVMPPTSDTFSDSIMLHCSKVIPFD